MRRLQRILIVFLCLCTMTYGKSRKEDLERAAELAVEQVAERVAERAVEKALESGNSTTETKTVRQSYSSVRKEVPRDSPEDYEEDYVSKETEEPEEDDEEHWRSYPHSDIWSSKLELGDLFGDWRRFPRSDGSREDQIPKNYHRNYHKPLATVTEKNIPLFTKSDQQNAQGIISTSAQFETGKMISSEKKSPSSFYENLRFPSVKVPMTRSYLEKKALYPMKVLVNVPIQVSESQQVDKLVSYRPEEVKVDRAGPYKVEVPVSRPYTVRKRIPVEVKDSKASALGLVDQSYPIQVPKPYFIYVIKSFAVPAPKSYPDEINASTDKSYRSKIPESRSYVVQENQPVPLQVSRPYPFIVQMPVPTQITWNAENKMRKDLEESETRYENNAKWQNSRNRMYKFH